VITGASSGLGFFCVEKLNREDVYVVAAVRDTAKMDAEAERSGISTKDYVAVELQLASFQSVKDFATALKATLPRGKLDRLVCNAAVYLPTDPIPRWTDDGYEMSLQVNHLGHFLLSQLLLPSLEKAQKARLCIVGSVTGNKNTVAGSLVKPVADVGELAGLQAGAGHPMVDGAKKFDGAKAYKDAKALNMMTVLEMHRRLHASTGIVFNSMCVAGSRSSTSGLPSRCLLPAAGWPAAHPEADGSTRRRRYPGCIASTNLFREKREWFRYFFFPTLMKAIDSYVTQPEAGERLAAVVVDDETAKSGVSWLWNGNAQYMGPPAVSMSPSRVHLVVS
jgi:protochlorophyllide reductase